MLKQYKDVIDHDRKPIEEEENHNLVDDILDVSEEKLTAEQI